MRIILTFATRIEWHEGHQIARALTALGHTLRLVDVVDDPTPLPPHVEGFPSDTALDDVFGDVVPDLYLYIEPRGLLARGLETAPCRTACILSDTALSLAPRFDLAQLFDDVLLYHRDALDAFTDRPRGRVHWTPVAIDPTIFKDRSQPRDLDLAFTGSMHGPWSRRATMLARIGQRYRLNDVHERHSLAGIAALYNRARMVFNAPIANALNPRIFEAIGCGALLLSQRCDNGIERLFVDGEHLVLFDDEGDLMTKIEYYHGHEAERARIARAGYAVVQQCHTYEIRMLHALQAITALPRHAAPARRFTTRAVRDIYERRHKQAGQAAALFRTAAAQSPLSGGHWRSVVRGTATLARQAWRDLRE